MSPEECDRCIKRASIKWTRFKESKPVLSLQVDHEGRRKDLAFMLDTGAARTVAPMSYLASFYTEAQLFRDDYEIDAQDPIRPGDRDGKRTGVCLRGHKVQRQDLWDAQGGRLYGITLPVVLNIVLIEQVLPIKESIVFSNEIQRGLLGRSSLRDVGVAFLGTAGTRYFGLFAAPGARQQQAPPRVYDLSNLEGGG